MPRRHLACPGARSHDEQVRDVDDADEQDDEHAAPEDVEHALHVADDVVAEHDGDGAEIRVLEQLPEVGKSLVVPPVERIHLLAHLLEAGPVAQAADHLVVVAVARLVALL
jgi:hypothetical protein